MANILMSIIWLIILIFIGFWIAGIAAGIYILVLPFTVCIEPLTFLMGVFWLCVLLFISYWIAFLATFPYIFLIPFTVCIEALSVVTDFLLDVIQFPKYCTEAMMEGRRLC